MTSSPLKSQVVSLELSKRLKELGVPQESMFYWVEFKTFPVKPWQILSKDELRTINFPELAISAFLVGELGEMFKKAGSELTIKAYGDLHGFKGTGAVGSIGVLWLLTEPDRLAKMLIYLLENNLIKASDL